MDPRVEMIEKRLQRLERSNRHLKLGCLLAVVGLTALGSISAQQVTKRTIDANEFVLRGPDGRVRATLLRITLMADLSFLAIPGKSRAFSRQIV